MFSFHATHKANKFSFSKHSNCLLDLFGTEQIFNSIKSIRQFELILRDGIVEGDTKLTSETESEKSERTHGACVCAARHVEKKKCAIDFPALLVHNLWISNIDGIFAFVFIFDAIIGIHQISYRCYVCNVGYILNSMRVSIEHQI